MKNIRTRRRALGLTMKQLASAVGVSEAAISHYEVGRREPDPDMLKRIANTLGVTVDYLLGRDDPAPIEKPSQTIRANIDYGFAEAKNAPTDMRAEAKRLLDSMTDDEYERALAMLKLLQNK